MTARNILTAFFLLLVSNLSHAVTVTTAAASIDWNTFTVSSIPLPGPSGPAISISPDRDFSSAQNNTTLDEDEALYTSAVSFDDLTLALVENNGAESTTNPEPGKLESWAEAINPGFASAITQREGSGIVAAGSGILVFSVGYTLDVNSVFSEGQGTARADIFAFNDTTGAEGHGWDLVEVIGAGVSSASGFISSSIFVNPGDTISILASTTASASVVPLPPAFWLFAFALIGVASVARRRT